MDFRELQQIMQKSGNFLHPLRLPPLGLSAVVVATQLRELSEGAQLKLAVCILGAAHKGHCSAEAELLVHTVVRLLSDDDDKILHLL